MAGNSRRVCTHRESSAMDVAATATARLATCTNVGGASARRRWPAPPDRSHRAPVATTPAAPGAGSVTPARPNSLALRRPRPRRKPCPACTRGTDFLAAEGCRCPANGRNVSAERADVGNLAPCVHAGWTFWHPWGFTGASCLRSRPACTFGTRFPTRGRSWPPANRGDAPTGRGHVGNLVLCVHAGRGFCRWEGAGRPFSPLRLAFGPE